MLYQISKVSKVYHWYISMTVSRAKTVHAPPWNISGKCESGLSTATGGYRLQLSGKHPALEAMAILTYR